MQHSPSELVTISRRVNAGGFASMKKEVSIMKYPHTIAYHGGKKPERPAELRILDFPKGVPGLTAASARPPVQAFHFAICLAPSRRALRLFPAVIGNDVVRHEICSLILVNNISRRFVCYLIG